MAVPWWQFDDLACSAVTRPGHLQAIQWTMNSSVCKGVHGLESNMRPFVQHLLAHATGQ